MNGPPGERSRGPQDPDNATTNGNHIVTAPGDRTRDVALYELGYGTGYGIGWADGWAVCDDEWQALLGVLRAALSEPRHTEVEAARAPTDEPCRSKCRSCSRCARYAAVHGNRERYGTPDYPGGGRWTS